jgi:prepilin-type N-terminal cleavage/methylation domain-containing protein
MIQCRIKMNNESGLTLIEVLASIAIFSIALILITNVIINSFSYHDKSYDTLKLGQEANLFITKIRTVHEQVDEYTLKYDTTGKLYINTGDGDRLFGKEDVYRYELSAELVDDNTESISYTVENDLVVEDELVVDTSSSVFCKITIVHEETNKSITLETTLSRLVGGN